jgi:hypothetical protein
LFYAVVGGSIDCMKLMYKYGATMKDVLNVAASNNHPHCIKFILETGTSYGYEDLNEAARSSAVLGHAECLKLIIGKTTSSVAEKILALSARNGSVECMRLAIGRGAYNFTNALLRAVRNGHHACAQAAIEAQQKSGIDRKQFKDMLRHILGETNDPPAYLKEAHDYLCLMG